MSQSYLIPGIDLLALACITPADVQQAIANAKPQTNIGFVIISDNAPDVVAQPELANFIWLRSVMGVPNGEFYYYNGVTWVLLSLIDGATLANNSVSLNKLSLTGSAPYYIIQVNAAGNALQYISIPNAIQNGTIPVNKLVSGGAAHVLVSLAGANQFVTLASLVNYFAANTLPISTLVRGGVSAHGLFLRTFEDGTTIEWADFDPNEQIDNEELNIQKLKASSLPVGANQSFRRNATNTAWEAYTPISNILLETYGTNAIVGATQDIALTKPADKTWQTFEIAYCGAFDDNGVVGPVKVDFTWQTAPLVGSAIVPSSSLGCGNGGQLFTLNNSDDTISPTWMFKGTVPAGLVNVNTLTLRAAITLAGTAQTSGVFMGKGVYNA